MSKVYLKKIKKKDEYNTDCRGCYFDREETCKIPGKYLHVCHSDMRFTQITEKEYNNRVKLK